MMHLLALSLLAYTCAFAQSADMAPVFDEIQPTSVEEITAAVLPEQSLEDLQQIDEPESNFEPIPERPTTKAGEIDRLMQLPAYNLQTSKAPLNDVLALLADACGMSYVGLEKGVGEDVQISVNINKNPYETLKYLAKRYNVAVDYDESIWHFAIYNDNELIARVYKLLYNNQESVTGGSVSVGGGSSEDGGDSSSSASSEIEFEVERDVIKNDVETFLGMSSQNPDILVADDFDVKNLTQLGNRGIFRVRPEVGGDEGGSTGENESKVIYNSDNKTLYVLATRAQHQWIEKYLLAVDKPQRQILVETKVYETGLNPQSTLGFDWSGSKGNYRFNLNPSQLPEAQTDGEGTTTTSAEDGISAFGGLTAIISAGDLSSTIRFLNSDSNTVSVQYPRQVTVSNRQVAIASVEKVPVKKASESVDTSTSGSSTSTEVEEIDVGTSIAILPRIIDEDKVHMNIAVTVSSITGYRIIDGNEYPVVSERVYKTEAIVESGYTLAIGGLKETAQSDTISEVPVLSKIPVMGGLFKQRSKSQTDRNLLIFISPYILTEYRGGIKDEPEFVLPRYQDYPERRLFEGTADESYSDVLLSLAGLEREIELLAQKAKEGLNFERLPSDVAFVENELELMEVRLEEIALDNPNKDISEATHKIREFHNDLNEIRRNIRSRRPRY